ncbi:MAG: hypothetical protein ACJAWA_002008, partial [Nonlabens sp.]
RPVHSTTLPLLLVIEQKLLFVLAVANIQLFFKI